MALSPLSLFMNRLVPFCHVVIIPDNASSLPNESGSGRKRLRPSGGGNNTTTIGRCWSDATAPAPAPNSWRIPAASFPLTIYVEGLLKINRSSFSIVTIVSDNAFCNNLSLAVRRLVDHPWRQLEARSGLYLHVVHPQRSCRYQHGESY
jgi:hypothetical protein